MAELDYCPLPEVAEERRSYDERADAQGRGRAAAPPDEARPSERLDFERAAELRDKAQRLEQQELGLGG